VNANESTSHASRVGALADWESRFRIKIVSGAFSDFSAWTGNE
jgi:stress-induced morphogen